MTHHCQRRPEKVYGLDFTKEEIDDAVKNGKLLSMDLETSLECNLRCIYCYSKAGKKRSNELTTEQIFDIVDQAVALGVKVISVIGGGEPLMHPNILKILDYIATKPVERILFTNATLITKEVAQHLKKNKVSVVMKTNSRNPEIQDKLAGRAGTFDQIASGMQNLLDAGYPDKDTPLGIETIICKQNINELPELWQWARDRNIVPYFETVTFMGRAREHDLNVSSEEVGALFETLLKIDREKYDFTWETHPPIAALSCRRNLYNCVVTSNGYVFPCVGVNVSVGNVRYTKLGEMLKTSPVIQSLRNIRQNIKGHCKVCEFAGDCYGCRGMAYHVCGDFLASDPFCWRNPEKIV